MGFILEYDAKHNVLRVTLDGLLTDAILAEGYAATAKYVASHPPCHGITDVTGVEKFDVSSGAIKRLAGTAPAFPTEYMKVFVAPKDFVYGMARMFQIIGGETRPNLHIVRTLDEAYRLLQMESPEFSRIT
jgi:hypothetical protein